MKAGKIRRTVLIVLIVLIALAAVFIAGAYRMFSQEIRIISSITRHEGPQVYYVMDYDDDYHYEDVFSQNVSSDSELAVILSGYISHGFYKADNTAETHIGCSTLTCVNEDGNMVWGRNFDWYDSVPIIVRAKPHDGYASISTCEFSNITGNTESVPEDMAGKFLAIAAYYVPMDGVNEKGLCVAHLEINEGGQELVDTEKQNITVTMATRMLLDKAATVDEAIALLKEYDICPSGGISSHLSISDASGRSVAAEFMNGEVVITETPAVTNFNISNGDIAAGGESAERRYSTLMDAFENSHGLQSAQDMTQDMKAVSQTSGKWMTRWTIIYEHTGESAKDLALTYYWLGDFENGVRISLKDIIKQ